MQNLLIIAPSSWKNILETFTRYKNDTGMPSNFISIEDIDAQFEGKDGPEKIKHAIETQHRLFGVKYVMLVGDVDICPVRYIKAINTQWGTRWYPSDLYYSDLYDTDGNFNNWDADSDGIFGEVDFTGGGLSGTNLDKINMIPDVAVGRVPASTYEEASAYLQKVMSYEFSARESYNSNYDSDWAKKALFVVDGGKSPFGDIGLAKQYAQPLSNSGISVTYRYQNDPPWDTDPGKRTEEITNMLNSGVGFLCYFGHGDRTSFSGWYSTNDVANINNKLHLPIIYAISCLTAHFHFDLDSYEAVNGGDWTGGAEPRPEPAAVQPSKHDRDSMAEEFLLKHTSGAVAYIGTTEVIEHGGKNLARYFFDAYQNMSKPPVLGDLWQNALSRFAGSDALQGMGGYYAFIHIHKVMLFGDPSLRVGGLQRHILPSGNVVDPEIMQVGL